MLRKQECIPVGCVPSAAVAVSGGGRLRGRHPPDPGSIRWTGKELGANPVQVFMSGDLGGKQSHAFPLKTIQMH